MLSQYQQINQSLIQDGISPNELKQLPEAYLDGEWSGKIGEECKHPEDWDYFHGWALGHREYKCKQNGIILPDEF